MADLTGTEHLDDEVLSALVDARRGGGATSPAGDEHAAACPECGIRLRAMEWAAEAVGMRPPPSSESGRERALAAAMAAFVAGASPCRGERQAGGRHRCGPADKRRPIGSASRHRRRLGGGAAFAGVAALGALAALAVLGLTLASLLGGGPAGQHGASRTGPSSPSGGAGPSFPASHGSSNIISLPITASSPLELRQLLSSAPGACRSPSSEAGSSAAGDEATFDDDSARASSIGAGCVRVGGPIISLQPPLPTAARSSGGSGDSLVISVPGADARRLSAFEAAHPTATVAVVANSVVVAYLAPPGAARHGQSSLSTQRVALIDLTPSAADALAAALRG